MDELIRRMNRMETVLERLEPKIIEIHAVMSAAIPHLATKAEMAAVEVKLADTDRRLSEQIGREIGGIADKIAARPTTTGVVAIFGLFAAVAAAPFFQPWWDGAKTLLGLH